MRKFLRILFLAPLLFLNACEKTDTAGNGTVNGVWVRLPGPSGDRTDLAIGGITGEPGIYVRKAEFHCSRFL